VIWVFYVSKVIEFGDTWIMVLKKNNHQVSFLHLYHHATIFPIWWWITFQFPGGDSYFSCAQNSFIHVVMYTYYLVRSFGINVPTAMKFLVTKGQMFQFLMNLFQATYVIVFDTDYPRAPAYLLLVYMCTLLLLFNNFMTKGQAAARRQEAPKDDKKTQ
jgi:elongation of very long chain fatty acids protein 4